jgi:hypothetical protein
MDGLPLPLCVHLFLLVRNRHIDPEIVSGRSAYVRNFSLAYL